MRRMLIWGLGWLVILLAVLLVIAELRLRRLRDEAAALCAERRDDIVISTVLTPSTNVASDVRADMEKEIVALRQEVERLTNEATTLKTAPAPERPAVASAPSAVSRIERRILSLNTGMADWFGLQKNWYPLRESEETTSEQYVATVMRETETFLGLTENQKVDFRQAMREFLTEATRQRDIGREYRQKVKELDKKYPDGAFNEECRKEGAALHEWLSSEAGSYSFKWKERLKIIGDRLAPLLDESNPRHKIFKSELKAWVNLF